jgi:hypothetical protein
MTPSNQLSPEQWLSHVNEWRASGLTRHAYCIQNGIKLNSLIYWIKRTKLPQPIASPSLTFLPAKVVSAAPQPIANASLNIQAEAAATSLILECRSGCNLILPSSTNPAWLGALLSALV